MKVKQKTICQACRKGKISCDGKRPACSQCTFRNLECPGYPAGWTFVPQATLSDAKVKPRRASSRRQTGAKLQAARERTPCDLNAKSITLSDSQSLGDLVLAIIDNYVPESSPAALKSNVEPWPRICGSWVEVLPNLVSKDTDTALASAIRAFAVTILSRGPDRRLPVSDGLEAYNQALLSVNAALQSPYSDFPVAIAAAVMCLLLAELFHATSLSSWTAHLQGLAGLMQLSRPEVYVSGIPHRLFVGATPALVVLAFSSRKASFLAEEEWKTVPFRETTPSPIQVLMSEAAVIPSILERLDAEGASTVADDALDAFDAVLGRLEAWADRFHSSASPSSPLFWFQPSAEGGREDMWFQDITVASALTHFWAFKVVCLRNIDRLSAASPGSDDRRGALSARLEEAKDLSLKICQSVEYLMQDRMKLFGPTSVTLPLRTAYETFEEGGSQTKEELELCIKIVGNLKKRGFAFMSFFPELSFDKALNLAKPLKV